MWKKLTSTLKGGSRDNGLLSPNSAVFAIGSPDSGVTDFPDGYIPVDVTNRSGPSGLPVRSLNLMTIAVEVYRQGDAQSLRDEIPQVHITTIGRTDPESKAAPDFPKSYDYGEFLRVFDNRLDENPASEGTRMKYGRLGYFTEKGDYKEVGNQKSFEKAIDSLFTHRGTSNIMKFIFQPEHHDKMVARCAAEQLVADKLAEETAAAEKATEEKRVAELAKRSSQLSAKTSRPNTSDGRQSQTERTSPVLAIQNAFKKVGDAVGAKQRAETREEQRHRLKSLFEEEGRKRFRKGGSEGTQTVNKINLDPSQGIDEVEPEEEHVDDSVTQEDRIAGQLQQLLNLEALSQLNGPKDNEGTANRWEECCRMFGRDPTHTEIDQNVRIAGLKTEIYQYQAFGVYWQMLNSRSLGGGFVADDMGLGKTLSFLAYIIVERQLSILWREVRKSRDLKDGKHLVEGQTNAHATCPQAGQPGWIVCPCAPSSPTTSMNPQPGLRMACVPPALVSSWWGQWKTHVDTTHPLLGMRIVVDHPAAFNDKSTIEDLNTQSTKVVNQDRMKADVFRKDRNGGKGYDHPRDHQAGWLLLTTKENYGKFAKRFESKGQVLDPENPGEWKSGIRVALVFGIAMIDESHEEFFKNKGRAQILANLPTRNCSVTPFIWGYSGTPIAQTPRGLEGVLWAIEKHSWVDWATDPKFQRFEWKQLDAICKRFDAQIKSSTRDDAAVAQIIADFEPFMVNFIIRRTSSTDWFGHTLMKLKPHVHQDVWLKGNEKATNDTAAFEALFDSNRKVMLERLQANWDNFPEKRLSDIRPTLLWFNTMVRETWRSRLLATFPGLCKLAHSQNEADRLTLTEDEVIGFFRSPDQKERATPYGRHLKNIVETSPKCLWLYEFITQLNTQQDWDNQVEKLVILTAFPQAAFILKLFIQRYFPEDKNRVGVITQRMKASERQLIIDCFCDAKDDRNLPKYKREVKFLIGTTIALGKGLGLTRARNIVLMEPDNFTTESQAYGRVDRIGQRNPMSHSYRLIDASSDIEQKIIKRQVDRNESYGSPIEVEESQDIGLGIAM